MSAILLTCNQKIKASAGHLPGGISGLPVLVERNIQVWNPDLDHQFNTLQVFINYFAWLLAGSFSQFGKINEFPVIQCDIHDHHRIDYVRFSQIREPTSPVGLT